MKDTIEIVYKIAAMLGFTPTILGMELQSGRGLDKSFEKLGLDMMGRSVVWLVVFFMGVFFTVTIWPW